MAKDILQLLRTSKYTLIQSSLTVCIYIVYFLTTDDRFHSQIRGRGLTVVCFFCKETSTVPWVLPLLLSYVHTNNRFKSCTHSWTVESVEKKSAKECRVCETGKEACTRPHFTKTLQRRVNVFCTSKFCDKVGRTLLCVMCEQKFIPRTEFVSLVVRKNSPLSRKWTTLQFHNKTKMRYFMYLYMKKKSIYFFSTIADVCFDSDRTRADKPLRSTGSFQLAVAQSGSEAAVEAAFSRSASQQGNSRPLDHRGGRNTDAF